MALELIPTGSSISQSAALQAGSATFTVPAGQFWEPTLVRANITTDQTTGTRIPQLLVKGADTTALLTLNPTPTIAASLNRIINFYPTAAASAAFVNTLYATWPFPDEFILSPGCTINYFDLAAIAPTTDSGTATASDATTMTDTGKAWTTNQWALHLVTMGGSTSTVISNTATVLTFAAWSPISPTTGPYTLSGDTVVLTVPYNSYAQVNR